MQTLEASTENIQTAREMTVAVVEAIATDLRKSGKAEDAIASAHLRFGAALILNEPLP